MKKDFAGKFLPVLFCIFTFIFSAISILAQNNSIVGFVFGIERQPLAKVSVELQDDLNRMIARTETNGAGRYNFNRLSVGRYNIKVTPIGTDYEEQIKNVEITSISITGRGGAETFQENFYLQIKATSTALASLKNSVVFAQEVPKEAEKLYREAVKTLEKNQSEEGLVQLKKSLEIFPDYYLALEKLAQTYVKLADYKNAYDAAQKTVRVNDKSYEGWYIFGYSSYQFKNYDEAVKAFTKSSEILPTSVNSFVLLGVNLRQIGKYKEAEQALLKAKKLTGTPIAEIHWHLALLYTNNLKKYKEAISELELFLKAKPDFEETDKVKSLIKKLEEKAKNQ
jgi:tetratricopeptide (TPR) repeat protein